MKLRQRVETLLFVAVLFIGAIFRFYHYADYTITNDELSGIMLSSVKNLHELYNSALKDGHPIGYIFFLHYWIQFFGSGLAALRLPFILSGLGAVVLVCLIGCKWFGKYTALLAATCFSLLTFTVLYSQLARPYSFGLFFSLLSVYCWTGLVFPDNNKPSVLSYIGFVLAGFLAMIFHYFAFLAVATAGLTGLAYVRGRQLKYYLLCGAVIILMYLPFTGILFTHLKAPGLGWLGKPDSSFFLNFMETVFNNDHLLLYVFVAVMLVLAWESRKRLEWNKFQTISILFFAIPFIIGFVKSVIGKPVLQDRVLLFQLPYLLLFLCSFQSPVYGDNRQRIFRYSVWGILTFTAICSFLFRADYFKNGFNNFGNFKKVSDDVISHYKQYGEKQVTWAASVNHPSYITYYTNQADVKIPYSLSNCEDDIGMNSLRLIVYRASTPYFYFLWCHNHYMPVSKRVIREKFPVILEEEQQLRNGTGFFARDMAFGDTVFHSYITMDSIIVDYDAPLRDDTTTFAKANPFFMRSSLHGPWPSFNRSVKETGLKKGDRIMVKAKVQGMMNGGNEAVLVQQITGSHPEWKSISLQKYDVNQTGMTTVYFLTTIENDLLPDDHLHAYFYNPGGDIFYVDDMEVIVYRNK